MAALHLRGGATSPEENHAWVGFADANMAEEKRLTAEISALEAQVNAASSPPPSSSSDPTPTGMAFKYRIESSTKGGQPIVKIWTVPMIQDGGRWVVEDIFDEQGE
jgi:hypothetical protein